MCNDSYLFSEPDTCPVGYFGDLCSYRCHCSDATGCDKMTGVCNSGSCTDGLGWRWLSTRYCTNFIIQESDNIWFMNVHVKGLSAVKSPKGYLCNVSREKQISTYKLLDISSWQTLCSWAFLVSQRPQKRGGSEFFCVSVSLAHSYSIKIVPTRTISNRNIEIYV